MRNSQAQKYARWSAMVALLLAVGVVGVYLRRAWLSRQAEKKAPPAVPSTVAEQSDVFSYSKVEGQRTIYTVRASRATEFKEGSRNLLEDVSITVYGKKGERNDTLRTQACDFISTTGKITCSGDAQISLDAQGDMPAGNKAVQVTTSSVSFDRESGEARSDKPVTFRWPEGSGRARGVAYDSDSGILRLEHDVELSLKSPTTGTGQRTELPEKAPTNLTGDRMVFEREAHRVRLLGSVHGEQASHELRAENLLLELDKDLRPRQLIATGSPQFQETGTQGPMALQADEITAQMTPAGSIASIAATGNVHANRSTTIGEDNVAAGRLQMNLASRQNLPRLLTAAGGVVLTSRSTAPNSATRRVDTDAMELRFSNGPVPGETRIESVKSLAPARAEWVNTVVSGGKPVEQTARIGGREMALKFDGKNQLQQLVSTGNVEVTRQLGSGLPQVTTSRELIAKFDSSGEWSSIDQAGDVRFREGDRSGQGDRAHADRATNNVTLTGSVVLTDATMRTTAQTAVFRQGSNEFHADGKVLTTELRQPTGNLTNFAPEPAHISAEHLVADTAKGHAAYSEGSRLWQGQTVIEADTIELDNPTHILVARGRVRGVFPQVAWSGAPAPSAGKTARPGTQLGHIRGGLLTYWDLESRARLEQDASADSPNGAIHASRIDLYFSGTGPASASKQLDRAVALGDVTVRQQDRRGTSERAEYTASEGKFVLSEGKPTLYDSTGDTTTGRQLTFFFADDRIIVDSEGESKTVTLHRVEK